MGDTFTIRLISLEDAPAVLEIYKPYVLDTVITFEYEVPTPIDFLNRIRTNTSEYPWLVCLQNHKIVGYAYASKHRDRTAYKWSVDSAVYLSPSVHRKGIARILYESLFSILRLQGYFNVYAGICLPNEKSVAFHKALGFKEIALYEKVGFKHHRWHDTAWFELHLSELIDNPPIPKKITELINTPALLSILKMANETAGKVI
jgi:L-amino acid N-acyltransferase YncA